MVVLNDVTTAFYLKSRPDRYEATDAAYPTGGNSGLVIAQKPRDYEMTPQQKFVQKLANEECNIEKGMSKEDLQNEMVDCIKPNMRKFGNGEIDIDDIG